MLTFICLSLTVYWPSLSLQQTCDLLVLETCYRFTLRSHVLAHAFKSQIRSAPAFHEMMLTLQDAYARCRQTRAHPGKPGANTVLKECRERLRSPVTARVNELGLRLVVTDEIFPNWAAYLAVHPEAKAIFRSPLTEMAAEVLPERPESS